MSRFTLWAGLALAFAFSSVRAGDDAPRLLCIPLALQHGLPTTQATIAGKPVTLFLDVGNHQGMALEAAVLKRRSVRLSGDAESWRDADGHMFVLRIFHAERLVAGGVVATQFDGNSMCVEKKPVPSTASTSGAANWRSTNS